MKYASRILKARFGCLESGEAFWKLVRSRGKREREREREIEKGVDMETGRKHRPYRRRPWLRVADEEQPKRGELAIAGGCCCIRGWGETDEPPATGGQCPRPSYKNGR